MKDRDWGSGQLPVQTSSKYTITNLLRYLAENHFIFVIETSRQKCKRRFAASDT